MLHLFLTESLPRIWEAKPQQCQIVAADHGLARRTPGRLGYTKSEVVLQFRH
jgi:hypothetical protein